MDIDAHDFLLWLIEDNRTFLMSDWRDNYIEMVEALYASMKDW